MISKDKHQKHAYLAKPSLGQFARYELAFLGAPCGLIESLVKQVYDQLRDQFGMIYIDADHGDASESTVLPVLMDMISHHRLDAEGSWNDYDIRIALRNTDLAIVNGNHFTAAVQIPIIHKQKEESLRRKLDRLTNVLAVIIDDCDEPFDFITDHLGGREVPVIKIDDIGALSALISSHFTPARINGLVLAGGKSSRMGMDKATIHYHGAEQQVHMATIMEPICNNVYISKRTHSLTHLPYPVIVDSFMDLGPFGAILSAFRSDPNVGWLITACDQPLLQSDHLQVLLDQRDPTKVATCFYNPDTDFPEPLITIWEPKAYPRLLEFLALGYSCPRKVLINSDIKLIKMDDNSFMKNVNTPQERNELSPEL